MVLALSLLLAAAPAHKVRIAVVDTQDVTGTLGPTAKAVTQVLVGESKRVAGLQVISAEEIRQLLGFERQRELLSCGASESCLAEIGGALGVDYLLTSQLGKLGSRFRLDLALLSPAKATSNHSAGGFVPAQEDALADATVARLRQLLTEAQLVPREGLQPAPALAASVSAAPGSPSHTAAYVTYGAAGVLAAGALVMTLVTRSTYNTSVGEFRQAGSSASAGKLGWMGPLTDGLWVGAVVAAGAGTYLYVSAGSSPAGSGGELGLRGQF